MMTTREEWSRVPAQRFIGLLVRVSTRVVPAGWKVRTLGTDGQKRCDAVSRNATSGAFPCEYPRLRLLRALDLSGRPGRVVRRRTARRWLAPVIAKAVFDIPSRRAEPDRERLEVEAGKRVAGDVMGAVIENRCRCRLPGASATFSRSLFRVAVTPKTILRTVCIETVDLRGRWMAIGVERGISRDATVDRERWRRRRRLA